MRILYVTPFVPWPVRVRSFNFLPRLAARHEVHLVALARCAEEERRAGYVAPFCSSLHIVRHRLAAGLVAVALALPSKTTLREAFFTSGAMCAAVRDAIARISPDVILVERWRGLQYVPYPCPIPVICDATDSMTLYNRRLMASGAAWERLVAVEEYHKFRRREPLLVARTDATAFCSAIDIAALSPASPRCVHLRNGVDLGSFPRKRPADEQPGRVVFWGNLDYRPNRHAIDFFLARIFPVIARGLPGVTLEIVGHGARRVLRRHLSRPSVIVSDFAPELQPAIARASVAVAPMTVGAGTSNKILQALAVGTPIVATSLACGDLPAVHGRHLLLADSAEDFAAAVLALLRDPSLRATLAAAGRSLAERTFDWEIVTRDLEELLRQFTATGCGPQLVLAGVV